MYLPSVEIFFENNAYGKNIKSKSLQDILEAVVPVQEKITVGQSDINEPLRIRHDMRLLCEPGAAEGVLAVYGNGGRNNSAVKVQIPSKIRQIIARNARAGSRFMKRRHQQIQFAAMPSDKEAPKMYFIAEQELCIREFDIVCMGETIEGIVYREWWKINVNDEKSAELIRMELGRGISSRFLKKPPCLRLD